MSEHVSKIKEAVYNPNSGLYARLRSLEQWRDATARNTWFWQRQSAVSSKNVFGYDPIISEVK